MTSPRGRSNRAGPRTLFADPPKIVYLVRHGESIAQTFTPEKRTRSESLRDCGLSQTGEEQACILPSVLGLERYRRIDFVVSSPLTRAVQTSVLGFPSKPIVINYDLMEIGRDKNPIPENQPRPILNVIAETGGEARIDEDYFAPTTRPFPESHRNLPNSIRKAKLPKVWSAIWELCNRHKCQEIAVVCHFNIIQTSLGTQDIKPKNAIPIKCHLYRDGTLELHDIITNKIQEMGEALLDLKQRNRWCMKQQEDDGDGGDDNEELGSHQLDEKETDIPIPKFIEYRQRKY